MTKNKIIYVVVGVVAVAIVIGGLFLSNKNKTAKNETPTPASSNGTTNSPSAQSNSSTGEVTISGAINKTLKINHISAIPMGHDIRIDLAEKDASGSVVDGVELRIADDKKPGTYTIEPERNSSNPGVYAKYQIVSANSGSEDWLSNTGTLTLTGVSSYDSQLNITGKFSGDFKFTAVDLATSKTIDVKGSFADILIGQNPQ